MTTPVPPWDPAHPQVGNVTAWLNTGKHKSQQGDLFVMTVRVPNATVTAVMTKADAQRWIKQMQEEIEDMSSLPIFLPGEVIPPNGRPG
jgi:hypothetical protein